MMFSDDIASLAGEAAGVLPPGAVPHPGAATPHYVPHHSHSRHHTHASYGWSLPPQAAPPAPRGVSADGLSSIADDPDTAAAVYGALSAYGTDSLSSYALPSDPAALQGLIDQLQVKFPSIAIPAELQEPEDIPPPSAVLPGLPGQPRARMTEESLRVLAELHPPMPPVQRLESSVDLNSPVRVRPSTSPMRDPIATARVIRESEAVRLAGPVVSLLPGPSGAGPPDVPYPPTPPLPPGHAAQEAPPQPVESAPSPRETFYDQLGRQLTGLLLEAGTPLPRFPVAPQQSDTQTQTLDASGDNCGADGQGNSAGKDASTLSKARAAAEMFLKDYYEHKRALGEAERKLNTSENENLALRSQLDLSMVKMIGAQKEVDKYSAYFNMSRGDGPNGTGSESAQVKALLKKMQEMCQSLQKAEEEKLRLMREEERRIQEAVKRAVAEREEEMLKMKSHLKEKKKVIKDMKLMLHSYLANNDASSTGPNMAFLDLISHTDKPGANISIGAAL